MVPFINSDGGITSSVVILFWLLFKSSNELSQESTKNNITIPEINLVFITLNI